MQERERVRGGEKFKKGARVRKKSRKGGIYGVDSRRFYFYFWRLC